MPTVKETVKKGKNYKKGDLYKVPPNDIKIIDGLNASNRCDDLSDILDSIRENGVQEPIQGYRDKGEFYLTSGHRRLSAVKILIKEGIEYPYINFIAKPKVNESLLLFDIITHNTGKRLTELQEGEIFQRMVQRGFNQEEIAKKIGKTQALISQRIKLLTSISKYLKNCMVKEILSAHAATRLNDIHEDEKDQKVVVDKILIKKAKLKGKKPSVDKAISELKKIGKCKISSTDIPNKPGRQKAHIPKRLNKYDKIFGEAEEYMKSEKFTPARIQMLTKIRKALNAKTPQSLVKTIFTT